ncbi:Bifunctional enzyme Fae/Hps [Bienertia sinuspersici]
MEPKIAGISKKIWKIVKVAIFMIKKGLSKRKMFMDLNMMMKRGKISTKSLKNLMFHHHQVNHHDDHQFSASQGGVHGEYNLPDDSPREYEFSCSDTPSFRHYFTTKRKNRNNNNNNNHTTQCYVPYDSPYPLEKGESVDLEEVNNMLEMMLHNDQAITSGGSPALPGLGFGQSPAVRQLRITDSPFPVQNSDDNKHVDQAAEDFINMFYSRLKKEKN